MMKHGLPGTWQGPTTVIRTRRRHLAHAHCCINTYPQPGDMSAIETAQKIGGAASTANDAVGRIRVESSRRVAAGVAGARRSALGKAVESTKARGQLFGAAVRESLADSGTADSKAAGGTKGEKPGPSKLAIARRFAGVAGKAFSAGVSAATKGAGGTTKPPATRTTRASSAADPPSAGDHKSAKKAASKGIRQKQTAFAEAVRGGTISAVAKIRRKSAANAKSVNDDSPPARARSRSAPAAPAAPRRPRRSAIRGRRRHHEDDPYPLNALRPGERQWTYEE